MLTIQYIYNKTLQFPLLVPKLSVSVFRFIEEVCLGKVLVSLMLYYCIAFTLILSILNLIKLYVFKWIFLLGKDQWTPQQCMTFCDNDVQFNLYMYISTFWLGACLMLTQAFGVLSVVFETCPPRMSARVLIVFQWRTVAL